MASERETPAELPIRSKTFFKVCSKLVDLGAQLAQKQMLDEAILIFEQLILLHFGSLNLYTNLGYAYYEKGLLDKAIKYLVKAIKVDPKVVDAYELLGTLYAEKGEFGKAIKYYEKALKLAPDDDALLTNMGKTLIDQGLTKQALEFLEKSKKIKVGAAACNNLGVAYKKLGLTDKAIDEFKLAALLEPNCWLYHSNLGEIFLETGYFVEAKNEFLKGVELVPDSAIAHNALGIAYAKNNQFSEARKEFEIAKQLDPSLEIVQQNLEIITERRKEAEKNEGEGITKGLSLVPPEGYCELTEFEERFRLFIIKVMESTFGPYWQNRQISPEVRERWMKRKETREAKAWEKIEKLHPIFYSDFSDYSEIIQRRDNWNRVFKKYFDDRDKIIVKLKELNPIRNDLGHRGKHVSPQQLAKLEHYIKEILFCIEKVNTDKE